MDEVPVVHVLKAHSDRVHVFPNTVDVGSLALVDRIQVPVGSKHDNAVFVAMQTFVQARQSMFEFLGFLVGNIQVFYHACVIVVLHSVFILHENILQVGWFR